MARKTRKKRPITPDDLKCFKLVSSPRISPDGRQIVFVVKHVGDKNEYVTNLWIVDADGQMQARQFSSGGKDSSPAWSHDGNRIAFLSGREKYNPQIYTIDPRGGEAQQLTKFPEGSIGKFIWSPDGKWLAVSYREQDPQWSKAAEKEREEKGLSTPARVIDDWWYRLDGDGYFNAQRFQLFVVDTASGEHRRLYAKDTLGGFDFDWSPESRELVVSTNRSKRAMIQPWKDDLVRVDAATGKATVIEGLPVGPKACPRWSPDGKWIAYAGRAGDKDGIYSTENLELWICDLQKKTAGSLTGGEDYCLLSTAIADTSEATFEPVACFSPDSSRVFTQVGHHGEMHVVSVPVGGGAITFHTNGETVYEMGNFSASGRQMSLTVGSPTRLSEIAVGKVRRGEFGIDPLTDLNAEIYERIEIAMPKSQWVKTEDGHKVHVWTIKPPGLKAGKKVPAVLEIHGGPHAQYGWGLFHEFQVLAANGYAVFFSNPRGSKGYGRDHCAAIRGDWGGKDWVDVQAVTKLMQRQTFVDEQKMGVMGGSYGGYMTNWTISHCHDFAAAITDRCVSNLISMSGTSDFVLEPDGYFPGNAWDRPEVRWRQSPLAYFGNVKTPTMVIHSEGDLRCNVEQGEQVFMTLKVLGVPSRMVRYPSSTSHGMSRQGPPDLRIHRLNQILQWWEKYLK